MRVFGRRVSSVLVLMSLVLCVATAAVLYFHYVAYYMNRENCAMNLKVIGEAAALYAGEKGGHYPDSFITLMSTEDLTPGTFYCPDTTDTPATGPTTQAVAQNLVQGGHLSYIYVGRELTSATVAANTVVAFEPLSNHGDGMNVLFGDGHVEFVDRNKGKMIESEAAAGLPVITAVPKP